jgi:amino-acid N-acetyltransferase
VKLPTIALRRVRHRAGHPADLPVRRESWKNRVAKEDIQIERFSQGDEKELVELLSQAKLPTQDLTLEKLKHFLVAKGMEGSVIGAIGVELYQDAGLLRSLVVHPPYRGKGLGKRLMREVESLAQQRSVKTLFLLTTAAAEFFPQLGYQVIQRDRAPASIAKTEEFKNICPVSALCFFKSLDPA